MEVKDKGGVAIFRKIISIILCIREQTINVPRAVRDDDYDKAIAILEKGRSRNMGESYFLEMIAKCYEWKGEPEKAIEYAEKKLAIEPNDFEMLMLYARYWNNKEDDEMTYKYVCRVVENPPEPFEGIPDWGFRLLKPFELFLKRFKGIEAKARKDFSDDEINREENLKWAGDFKEWYESITKIG